MEYSFEVERVSVEPYGRNGVSVTVEVEGSVLAENLTVKDRLEGLDVDDVREWLLKNDNHDDILEAIGEEKIHEFLSHSA
ncbi:hypothetical protein NHF39_23185 [Pseudomonas proteolytica]|nr:hypothetical protein [Pseudomonas proteolytica]USW94211.1 hypothetical protein NHF39_23185 [Pseudomonas proteolytica]USX01819.1 hypothetical protein NHF41_08365 [Pseudomonas proteolytica]